MLQFSLSYVSVWDVRTMLFPPCSLTPMFYLFLMVLSVSIINVMFIDWPIKPVVVEKVNS
jgi:hypothetical protein